MGMYDYLEIHDTEEREDAIKQNKNCSLNGKECFDKTDVTLCPNCGKPFCGFHMRIHQTECEGKKGVNVAEKIMGDFWKEKYDDLVAYLKNRYGASWTLSILTETADDRKQSEE